MYLFFTFCFFQFFMFWKKSYRDRINYKINFYVTVFIFNFVYFHINEISIISLIIIQIIIFGAHKVTVECFNNY